MPAPVGTLATELPWTRRAISNWSRSHPDASGRENNPLPPASESPGQAGASPADGAPRGRPVRASPDKLALGQQTVALTVDVVAPKFLNLNQETTLKIVVRNTGTSDAMGVGIRDESAPAHRAGIPRGRWW